MTSTGQLKEGRTPRAIRILEMFLLVISSRRRAPSWLMTRLSVAVSFQGLLVTNGRPFGTAPIGVDRMRANCTSSDGRASFILKIGKMLSRSLPQQCEGQPGLPLGSRWMLIALGTVLATSFSQAWSWHQWRLIRCQ